MPVPQNQEKSEERNRVALERKSPPFLSKAQKGWGTLKFNWRAM